MKLDKLQRRLNHLLRLYLFPIEKIQHQEFVDLNYWNKREARLTWFEILDLVEKLEIPILEVVELGQDLRAEKLEYKRAYRKRPIVQRRDNKDRTVGSRGSNRNKIRYPKKCRKTAWKRFYKLFPHLDPKNHQ